MAKMKYIPAYFTYRETLAALTDEQVGKVFRAALQYGEEGTIPDLDPFCALAFQFIRWDIDRLFESYDKKCEKAKESIQKRWEAEKKKSDTNVYGRIQPNTNVYGRYQGKGEGKEEGKGHGEGDIAAPAPKTAKKKFVPPTVEQVREYCQQEGYITVNPEAFVDHYVSNGWKVGTQGMKDWKATVRNWARRDKERGITAPPVTSFETEDFFTAALERSYGHTGGDET